MPSLFDDTSFPGTGSDDRRAIADMLRASQRSDPIPDIAHGSIPGLLGVALSDQMRAARSNLGPVSGGRELSAAPTRTDAPANTPLSGPAMTGSAPAADPFTGATATDLAAQARDVAAGRLARGIRRPAPAGIDSTGWDPGATPAQFPGLSSMAAAGRNLNAPAPAAASGPVAATPPWLPDVASAPLPASMAGASGYPSPPSPQTTAPGTPLGQPAAPAAQPVTPAPAAAAATPQQDNSLIPRDSLLGRLLGGLNNWRDQHRMTLIALAGGLAGAPSIGTGLGRAFQAAGPAMQADIKLTQQNDTERALIGRGLSPDIARAAASNPTMLAQLLPQLFGAKQLQHVTVKDSLGNDIPLTFDPSTGRYRDMGGNVIGQPGAAQGAASGVPGLTGGAASMPVEVDPTTGRDEKFLAALGPVDRAAVTSILNGDASAQGRNMQKYLPYAARAEPGFSQQTYNTRLATMKDFDPQGVSGKNLTAISTGLGHLDRLNGAIDKLGNFTILPSVANPVYNAVRGQFSPEYQRNVAGFRQDVNAVAGEMAKAFRASGMSEADIEHWRKSFGENSSPETMKAAAAEALHLLDSRLEAIGAAYNRGMGLSSTKPSFDLLSPEGRRIHEKLGGGGSSIPATMPATSQSVPPPAQREAGKIYVTPRGPMVWTPNGWLAQ